jgi:diguanylate cyclase (GGDEF)-like protein/PAS domain S-box-containing protein
MTDLIELMEAAFDSRPDGIALLGKDGQLVYWNRAAAEITGYPGIELFSRPIPEPLERLLLDRPRELDAGENALTPSSRGVAVETLHKLGHPVKTIAQRMTLRDAFGDRIGIAVVFHPADNLDALPHGEIGEGEAEELHASQAELEERLQSDFDDLARGGPPFGVLWIRVDQAQELHRSHGINACHAMLDKVRHAITHGLRPAEEMGRWGDGEFLVLAHERNTEMLAAHAQTLAGLARTADFRWWGDRISITVSVGAAQAANRCEETLAQVLARAQKAMEESSHAGGNRATLAASGVACLQS